MRRDKIGNISVNFVGNACRTKVAAVESNGVFHEIDFDKVRKIISSP